jgi:hypothetical protein
MTDLVTFNDMKVTKRQLEALIRESTEQELQELVGGLKGMANYAVSNMANGGGIANTLKSMPSAYNRGEQDQTNAKVQQPIQNAIKEAQKMQQESQSKQAKAVLTTVITNLQAALKAYSDFFNANG